MPGWQPSHAQFHSRIDSGRWQEIYERFGAGALAWLPLHDESRLASSDPNVNDRSFFASWRALALALLEYREGNFTVAMDWLKKCSTYPGQAPSCVATVRILSGMTWAQLGDAEAAATSLKRGREMIDEHFQKKLELGDNRTGQLQGWLMARIFLREADEQARTRHIAAPHPAD